MKIFTTTLAGIKMKVCAEKRAWGYEVTGYSFTGDYDGSSDFDLREFFTPMVTLGQSIESIHASAKSLGGKTTKIRYAKKKIESVNDRRERELRELEEYEVGYPQIEGKVIKMHIKSIGQTLDLVLEDATD